MKQPHAITSLFLPFLRERIRKAVSGKMVDVFSLKFQRNNRRNPLAVDSANGKAGEKGCIFHRAVEMKQAHAMTELSEKGRRRLTGKRKYA